jgi:hypothetical protein
MNKSISIIVLTALLSMLISSPAHAIKKCKDAEGKWHYGDMAVRSCEKSKVTTLTDRGFVESEKSAPKTEKELAAEEEVRMTAEAEAKRVKAEEDERNRILSVYETEADIDRQRDNQLNSVETNIVIHKSYIKSIKAKVVRTNEALPAARGRQKKKLEGVLLDSQKIIEEYELELVSLIEQKEQITQKFATEKEVYRSLTEGK